MSVASCAEWSDRGQGSKTRPGRACFEGLGWAPAISRIIEVQVTDHRGMEGRQAGRRPASPTGQTPKPNRRASTRGCPAGCPTSFATHTHPRQTSHTSAASPEDSISDPVGTMRRQEPSRRTARRPRGWGLAARMGRGRSSPLRRMTWNPLERPGLGVSGLGADYEAGPSQRLPRGGENRAGNWKIATAPWSVACRRRAPAVVQEPEWAPALPETVYR